MSLIPLLLASVVLAVPQAASDSTVPRAASDSTAPRAAPDSAALHRRAQQLQARFEELRRNALPRSPSSNSFRDCDEIVGRFCLRFGGGSDWEPVLDPPEIFQARGDLLDSLRHIASAIPGDGWVMGQLVHYLGEEGRWDEAVARVGDCRVWNDAGGLVDASVFARARPGWWCHALRGLALHSSDRYEEAERSFRTALDWMGPSRRAQWLDLDFLLDGEADDLWDDTRGGPLDAGRGISARDALRARIWALSDPLFLVDGNDRLTEHFARYTVSWIREEGENPYGLIWGWDLERLVVRYGEEMGWNRTRSPAGSLQPATVVGHHHPESRPFIPPGPALADPPRFDDWRWSGDDEHPVTTYAPPYAPDLRFEPYQIARFRRGNEMLVVAGYRLPPDTVGARSGGDPENGGFPEVAGPPEAALFLVHPDIPRPAPEAPTARAPRPAAGDLSAAAPPSPSGTLRLRAPMGEYVASLEVWSPDLARAGRLRRGIAMEPLPVDVAALSDLLLLDLEVDEAPPESTGERPDLVDPSPSGIPASLEAALSYVRPLLRVCAGETLGVAWELTGVGLRREAVGFSLTVEPPEPGILSRIGGFFGLGSNFEPLTVTWTENSPETLVPFFRAVSLTLPAELDPGIHRLRLEADLEGRGVFDTEREIEVRAAGDCFRG